MSRCPSCDRADLPPGASFCPWCGVRLAAAAGGKKPAFSETRWFQEGAEAAPEDLLAEGEDLPREVPAERYAPGEIDEATRRLYSLRPAPEEEDTDERDKG